MAADNDLSESSEYKRVLMFIAIGQDSGAPPAVELQVGTNLVVGTDPFPS